MVALIWYASGFVVGVALISGLYPLMIPFGINSIISPSTNFLILK